MLFSTFSIHLYHWWVHSILIPSFCSNCCSICSFWPTTLLLPLFGVFCVPTLIYPRYVCTFVTFCFTFAFVWFVRFGGRFYVLRYVFYDLFCVVYRSVFFFFCVFLDLLLEFTLVILNSTSVRSLWLNFPHDRFVVVALICIPRFFALFHSTVLRCFLRFAFCCSLLRRWVIPLRFPTFFFYVDCLFIFSVVRSFILFVVPVVHTVVIPTLPTISLPFPDSVVCHSLFLRSFTFVPDYVVRFPFRSFVFYHAFTFSTFVLRFTTFYRSLRFRSAAVWLRSRSYVHRSFVPVPFSFCSFYHTFSRLFAFCIRYLPFDLLPFSWLRSDPLFIPAVDFTFALLIYRTHLIFFPLFFALFVWFIHPVGTLIAFTTFDVPSRYRCPRTLHVCVLRSIVSYRFNSWICSLFFVGDSCFFYVRYVRFTVWSTMFIRWWSHLFSYARYSVIICVVHFDDSGVVVVRYLIHSISFTF